MQDFWLRFRKFSVRTDQIAMIEDCGASGMVLHIKGTKSQPIGGPEADALREWTQGFDTIESFVAMLKKHRSAA